MACCIGGTVRRTAWLEHGGLGGAQEGGLRQREGEVGCGCPDHTESCMTKNVFGSCSE